MRALIFRNAGLAVALSLVLLPCPARAEAPAGGLGISSALAKTGEAVLDSCNGGVELSYPEEKPWVAFGDTIEVRITFWTGSIQGGVGVDVSRVRFELDCQGPPGMPCTDAGPFVGYAGNLKTTCPVVWTTSSEPGAFYPNSLVFTADKVFRIPPREPQFCSVSFDVKLADEQPGPLDDGGRLGQAAGLLAAFNDAWCLTRSVTGLGSESAGLLRFCPNCDDGNVCTEDACERSAPPGEDPCRHKEIRCEDGDPCTADGCDPQTGCAFSPLDCDDGDACTADSCDPASGCAHEPRPCDDADLCTADSCDPASGACVHRPAVCDDGNGCTADACDPETGTCAFSARDTEPPVLSVTLSPDLLWPPNHRLVPVTAVIGVADACDPDPLVTLVSISCNETGSGRGRRGRPGDMQEFTLGTDDREFSLRATRAAHGEGRVYAVTYRAVDASGNAAEATALVRVPLR